jgi:chloride channel 2
MGPCFLGFSIGKEGPLVHICSIICNQLTRLPQFKRIRHNDAVVLQYLAAACAVGIQLAVGAPIGGILFSIEVTATYYLVENLWRTFAVVGISQLVVRILVSFLIYYTHWDFEVAIFAKVDWTVGDYDWPEIMAFIMIGVVAGVVGALFTKILTLVIRISKNHPTFNATKQRVFMRVVGVALLIAIVAYPIELVRNDLRGVIGFFLQKDDNVVWWHLLLILLAKFIFTLLSVGFTPIPAGIYSPVFTTGVVFGRFIGELFILTWPSLTIGRGTYAVVGGAALAASVTRTISVAVIVIELSQQLRLFFPALIAVLIAVAVARCWSSGVYDILIRQRDLPEMPPFTLLGRSTNKCAADIMRRDLKTLSLKSTFGDVIALLNHSRLSSFPLIDENGIFLGTIMRRDLECLLEENGFTLTMPQSHFDATHLLSVAEQVDIEEDLKEDVYRGSPPKAPISLSESVDTFDSEQKLQVYVNTVATNNTNRDTIVTTNAGNNQESLSKNANTNGLLAGSATSGVAQQAQLTDLIPYLFTTKRSRPSKAVVPVDTTVMQVTAETSLSKIHFLFAMLGLSHLYVTTRGKLVGIITRGDLIRTMKPSKSRHKATPTHS